MFKKDVYDLTSSQKNIWDTELFFDNTNINNISGCVFIQEKVDFKALEKALNLYVEKNDALRLKIKLINGTPYQYLEDYTPFPVKLISLENMEEVEQLNRKIVSTPFNLIESNLFTFTMFQLPNGFGGFYPTLHHLISDAWTMSLLISEVVNFYSSLIHAEEIDDSKFPSYIDYIKSQTEYFNSTKFNKDSQFWTELFNTEPEISYISNKNKHELDINSRRKSFKLPPDLYIKINDFCKSYHCTIYTFFMAVYSIYLAKINNSNSSIIGTPVLNRSGFKEKQCAGMFISSVPFKVLVDSASSFEDFLKYVSKLQSSIFRHQKYPYNKLLKDIKSKYNISENLYDMVLSYQNARDNKGISGINYSSKWIETGRTLDTLEIHFYDMDNTGSLDVYYDYQINKFNENQIISLHSRIMEITKYLLDHPYALLKDVEITDSKEKSLILNKFNSNILKYDKAKTFLQIFEEQVKALPNHVAITFENNNLTYLQLNKKANQLANIISSFKLPENTIVGILLERSIETIISMLAILKSGMAYMLIEKDLPLDRISFMMDNANSPLLITSSYLTAPNIQYRINIDTLNFDNIQELYDEKPCQYLSVVYTSGSTGTPKGVLIKRSSMINLVHGYRFSMNTDKLSNFLSTCSVAFDMFAAEVWIPLLTGKTLILANEEESKNPIFMSKLIEKNQAEFMLITSSKLDLLLSNKITSNCLKTVQAIQLGGEVLNPKFYEKLIKYTDAKIYNGYGPSETTSCCSCKYITSSSDINIGTPLPNVQIYICNKDLNLCPPDITGELCVAGDGVSCGYINNSESTNKKFVKNPFGSGLLYKTGDLARLNHNGEIEYIGRNDFQIKIRGLRVELEEINNTIRSLDGVLNSVTIIKKVNNTDCICAYIVTNKSMNSSNVKDLLSKKLPYYMIPANIIFMDKLPLTTNGKIDTKQLPEINTKQNYIAPTTSTQEKLANIFANILGIDHVSIDSNFFDIGGDSLSAIRIITEISSLFNVSLSIKSIFDYPTISSLSEYIDNLDENSYRDIVKKVEKADSYPASFAQKRIYYTVKMEGKNSLSYNTPGGIIFDEIIDSTKLEKCIQQLIDRHESLRTYFSIENSELKQKILDSYKFSLKVVKAKCSELNKLLLEFTKPFDLSKAPLFRMKLLILDNNKSVLLTDMHHIISDGQSISIFVDELCKLYNGEPLIEKTIDYKDFTMWELKNSNSSSFKNSEDYWISQFKDEIPILNMPSTYPRGNIKSFRGDNIYKSIENASHLIDLCKNLNTTPFMFLLTVYYILLYKYTMQNDIIVATPVVGREHSNLQNIIGMFVNTLVLRQTIKSDITFNTLLKNVSSYCVNSFSHQDYPFNELVRKLNIQRDSSRNPLFDTMFIYQNNGDAPLSFNDISANYYKPDNHTSKFDFSLEVTPNNDSFELRLEYCNSLYSKEFMQQFLEHYINIINSVMENGDITIKEIDMLSDVEKNTIVNLFNDTKHDYPTSKTIYKLFEEQAKKTPEYTAITFNDSSLTYKELDEKSNQLAWYLSSIGIKRKSNVAIMLPRSLEVIVSILGVLKTGSCYIPIDPSFPKNRIEYMLENSNCDLVLSFDYLTSKITFKNIVDVNLSNTDVYAGSTSSLEVTSFPDDPSYIIYTSGSTGKPKGVMLNQKALINLTTYLNSKVEFLKNNYGNMAMASVTTISFDIFIFETLICLQKGLNIIISTEDEQTSPNLLDKLISKNNIKAIQMTPSRMQFFIDNINLIPHIADLDFVILAGEAIPNDLLHTLVKIGVKKVYNGYGPSETTVFSTFTDVTNYETVNIGKPLFNTQIYILDNDKNPVPIGVPGEIYIAGDGLALEYINNPVITKTSFINNPFMENSLMYKTGDFAKYSENGDIFYIGRVDHQIKIRGLRIELEEIKNAILQYPNIEKALLVAQKNNDREFLVAYYTQNDRISVNKLKAYLKTILPHYMVPSYFMVLDDFPYLPNGKVDKKSLPIPRLIDSTLKTDYMAPKTDLEMKIVSIFEHILSVPHIGINDNFFDLGGDSLLAMHLQVELMKLTKNISYSDIFMYPTVHEIANRIRSVKKQHYSIDNYDDLYHLNKVIENTTNYTKTPSYNDVGNILLSGVTGFLGAHILDSFLKQETGKIYCIVRKEPGISTKDKLLKKLHFYFGEKYDLLINDRIFILDGDIIEHNLGLSDKDYSIICEKVTCVINSAAMVSHYGDYSQYKKVNVDGTENMLDFAKKFNKKFYQISTLSISGNSLVDQSFIKQDFDEDMIFKENNFYISQNLDNVYVRSKFEAEKLVLKNIENGLDGYILRIGNLMGRYLDGKFQKNVDENAYINRIISFSKLKCIPDYLLDGYLEFTPVDCCADSILKIIQYPTTYHRVFHLLNQKVITLKNFLKLYCKHYGIIDIISNTEFKEKIEHILSKENANSIINGIISDFDENMDLVYDSKVKLNSEFTEKYLKNIGFEWPSIESNYIIKFFDYLVNLGYIQKDI